MEGLQLLLESKLYELSQETLQDFITFLNMPDESRNKTIKRIQTEMENQARATGEDAESFWLSLKRTIFEDIPPLEDANEEEKGDSYIRLLKTVKNLVE